LIGRGRHRKIYLTIVALLLLICVTACRNNSSEIPDISYTDPVPDSCNEDSSHKFYISKPVHINAGQKIPLILAIDPHGDGLLAVKKFAGALQSIPAVIAGSQRLKNNYEGFEASISQLLDEVQREYPVDPAKVILAGFSGGARMAYYYGINHKVSGIIMYGAGPGRLPAGLEKKSLYAVSGTRDFNFMEQYVPLFASLDAEDKYFADIFRGTHEWPPAEYIYESVLYVLLNGQEAGDPVLEELADRLLSDYDSLFKAGDIFFAGKALEKAWHFVPGTKNKVKLAEQINTFKNNQVFLDYQEKFEAYLRKELKLKQAYAGKLADPDTAWWDKELSSLYDKLESCTDSMQADFYYRIKGFTGIILYSQINDLLRQGVYNEKVQKLLVTYERAEPESPDLYYFKALMAHHYGLEHKAFELLEKAKALGFSDAERIRKDFQGF
jgi:pimeloyl-ACP methyl ester carboxylesterase